jgi:hypothetical protein
MGWQLGDWNLDPEPGNRGSEKKIRGTRGREGKEDRGDKGDKSN